MSGVASLTLLVAATFSNYFSGALGSSRTRHYLLVAAALAFLFANWRAWVRQANRVTVLEKALDDRNAKFVLVLSMNLWRYDPALDKTLCFLLCKVINQGHSSVIGGIQGSYSLGTSSEQMTSYHLITPYLLSVGNERLTVANDDLLIAKTTEQQIVRGGAVTGRILMTLDGDRTAQLDAAQYQIDIKCFDYLGNPFAAVYRPTAAKTPHIIFHAAEKVEMIPEPAALPNARS